MNRVSNYKDESCLIIYECVHIIIKNNQSLFIKFQFWYYQTNW
jgi:hypothetical protein